MRGLSSTTFGWFGSISLLVILSFIRLLLILSYYAQGVLLQAIEGFLSPACMRFPIMNQTPQVVPNLWTCGMKGMVPL